MAIHFTDTMLWNYHKVSTNNPMKDIKWISVKEKDIPHFEKEVIATNFYKEVMVGNLHSEAGMIVCTNSEGTRLEEITHWMPLPKSPKAT